MTIPHQVRIRAGQVLGMLFLIGPAADLARSSLAPGRTALVTVLFGVFLALYLIVLPPQDWLLCRGRNAVLGALAAMWVVPALILALGAPGSFVALYVYCVAAAGILLVPRQSVPMVVVTAVGVGVGIIVAGGSSSGAVATGLTILAIGFMMAAFGRKIAANRELELAREELAQLAVSEERLRIARDLHDLLGHSLSVITLKAELAARLIDADPAAATRELEEIQDISRTSLSEVREAVTGYRRLALSEALDGARSALTTAGIDCSLDRTEEPLPAEVESALAWAVREGATNVIRHSDAQRCAIRVIAEPDVVSVEIEDDGRGSLGAAAGSGLAGLAERAARVRGTLEAGALRDGGYRLRLSVPRVAQ